tara:strand:+ start:12147 stop:12644 length:498 start_codon:yes stop_codon:yes gene_type:complete
MSRTYSPKDVDISFGGAINVDGWISITIGRNTDNTSNQQSADGITAYTKIADKTGTFEIEVQQQNSPVNAFMSALQQSQDAIEDLIFMDITVSDKSGGVLAYAKQAHLQKSSNQDLAAEAGSRNWMFFVENLQYLPNPSGFESSVKAVADANAAVGTLLSNTTNS